MTNRVTFTKGILKGLCPACREGKLFQGSMWGSTFLANHRNCPSCGVDLEPEPGFYWGAMYFNYAFNVAMLAGMAVLLYFGLGVDNVYVYILGMLGPVLLAIPVTGRLSRMLWIYIFGPYRYRGPSERKS